MFCVSSPNCRVFAQVIHTLAKIGDDVLFEPRMSSLVLKTKNMAESSYAETEFHANFFSTFSFNPTLYQEDSINFKVAMRSLVSVVKSPHSFDKNVDTCLLRYDQGKFQLTVIISYSKGTTKEYIIPHIEYESFEANFSKADAKNYIVSDACTLMTAANQFKSGEDEITLSSGKESSILENHLQNVKDCKTTVKTTVRVDHQYLETYSITLPTKITFCLKEFKALLSLSENVRLPIAFYFDTPGKPLILEVSEQNIFRINVLISTLQALPNDQQHVSQNIPASVASQSGQQSNDDEQQSAQSGSVAKNTAPSTSTKLHRTQTKANQNPGQSCVNDSNKTTLVPVDSHVPQTSQNLSQSNIPNRSQNNEPCSRQYNECNGSQTDHHTSNQNNKTQSQSDIPSKNRSNTCASSQNNENNLGHNGHNLSQNDLQSQNNNRNFHSTSLEPNNPLNHTQPLKQSNLEGLLPNDLILDANDFASDDFNLNPEPVCSEQPPGSKSPRSTKELRRRRRVEPDHGSTFEDIEAFIMDKRHSANSETPNLNHDNVEKSVANAPSSAVNSIVSTVFKRCFNPEENWKRNRPKIIVYSSDGLSDSD